MCKWGISKPIYVIRRNNPFVKDGRHKVFVDSCIADEVQILNNKGIITVGCCCGHEKEKANCLISYDTDKSKCEKLGYKTFDYDGRSDVYLIYLKSADK